MVWFYEWTFESKKNGLLPSLEKTKRSKLKRVINSQICLIPRQQPWFPRCSCLAMWKWKCMAPTQLEKALRKSRHVSSVQNGKDREINQGTACTITRKASQNSRFRAEDLQEDLADTGVVVNGLTDQWRLQRSGLHERVIRRKPVLHPHRKTVDINMKFAWSSQTFVCHHTCSLLGGNQYMPLNLQASEVNLFSHRKPTPAISHSYPTPADSCD